MDDRTRLVKEIRKRWPIARGTLAEVAKPCIRSTCAARARGEGHAAFNFTFRLTSALLMLPVVSIAIVVAPGRTHAACNLIPSARQQFHGTLGTTNKPYASPGDFVEVSVRPGTCDVSSSGLLPQATDHIVSVIFTPPEKRQRRVAFLTGDCSTAAAQAQQGACERTKGIGTGNVACIDAAAGLALVTREGEPSLSFRFPDTDTLFAAPADGRTLSGPAAIAVTAGDEPLPCDLGTTPCAGKTGLLACIDEIYDHDGTCTPASHPIFSHFTALPIPNDFQSNCFDEVPPCAPAVGAETRAAVDAEGNLLLPVNWQGILVSQSGIPVPRLMRATIKSPLAIADPPRIALASFTPEGARLAPIFEPQADATLAEPNLLSLFGSADAPYTILRVARRAGRCTGSANAGYPCVIDVDCPGGTCPTACVGGSTPGAPCVNDTQCPSKERCGALFDDFRGLPTDGGPIVLTRTTPAICQLAPHAPCASDSDCPTAGDACVSYALQAQTPVPLDSLTAGTPEVFAFTVDETVDGVDRNGDGDALDAVMTFRNRATGTTDALGTPTGCGIAGSPEGRAVVRVHEGPFKYPAIALEDDLLAFLESEPEEKNCDINQDFDFFDTVLRVFSLGGGEITTATAYVVDAAPRIDGRSLVVSNRRVFFRRSEAAQSQQLTERASVASGGGQLSGFSEFPGTSSDGRYVSFRSFAADAVAGDTNGHADIFVRDRVADVTERVSVATGGTEANGDSFVPTLSLDGQRVIFNSSATNLVPGDTNGFADVFLHDRMSGSTSRISLTSTGGEINGESTGYFASILTPSGSQLVAFVSAATNVVPGDTNGFQDVFLRDLDAGTTQRVSLGLGAGELNGPSDGGGTSSNGRYVSFNSTATNALAGDINGHKDVFLYDRLNGQVELASVGLDGSPGNGDSFSGSVSADGRYVWFNSAASNLVPNDTNGVADIFIHDRMSGRTERVSVATGELEANGASFGFLSSDVRYAGFQSSATNLVEGDTNGQGDLFSRDLITGITERVSVATDGTQANAGTPQSGAFQAANARFLLMSGPASNLVPGDTNGTEDVFIRGANPTDLTHDLFPNGRLTDMVLEVLDADTGTLTTLCPTADAAVATGRVVFLRPESSGATPGSGPCQVVGPNPGLPADLNDNGAAEDEVVQCWSGADPVQNLGRAATAIVMSPSGERLAALVDEAADGVDYDGDLLTTHTVVQLHGVCDGGWNDTIAQAADAVQFCGEVVAFTTPEAMSGADLNGDLDQVDRVLQFYDPAVGQVINTHQAVEDFVCTPTLVAFRTREAAQGAGSLNGPTDIDTLDDVLQTYTLSPPCLVAGAPPTCLANSFQAVQPCDLPACDPRLPYRVLSASVKFLTRECAQGGGVTAGCPTGGTDLSGNGQAGDLVIRILDPATLTSTSVGAVAPGSTGNPLQGGGEAGGDSGTVYVGTGRCIEAIGGACPCALGEFCDSGTCKKDQGVCITGTDCPPGIVCEPRAIIPASPDKDGDGVPDHVDNCGDVSNGNQADLDVDGAGDACDRATCGNGIVEYDEQCDGAQASNCIGACNLNCICSACANGIADPAKLAIKTRKESGQLLAKIALPLASYGGEPVTLQLDDVDPTPIAQLRLSNVAPQGSSGTKWLYKAKGDGLQKLQLRVKSGQLQVFAKAKRWFTAAAANGTVANTTLTLSIGTQCFTRTITKKTD